MISVPLAITFFGALALAFLDGRRRTAQWIAVLLLAASIGILAWMAFRAWAGEGVTITTGGWPAGTGIRLRADLLGISFALLSLLILSMALIFESSAGISSRYFPALVLFLATGFIGLFLTGDAFNFYVFFEVVMISSFVLSTYGEERKEIGSATTFVVINLLGSATFLAAVAGLYRVTGTLDIDGMARVTAGMREPVTLLIGTLIFVAFGLKLGVFPFHFWVPEVYAGTHPAVAAVLSGAVANVGSYALLRFGGEVLWQELALARPALLVLAVSSILYGSLLAISRTSTAEVLAYSSIGQAGYVLAALSLGEPAGYAAALVYAWINGLNKALLFLADGLLSRAGYVGLFVGAISVAGIPASAGFVAKAAVFRAGLLNGSWIVVAAVAAGSILSLIYMFQIYQRRYWVERPGAGHGRMQLAVVQLAAGGLLLLGLWPEPLLSAGEKAAAALTGGPG